MKTKEYREEIAQQFIDSLQEKGLSWKQGWISPASMENGITKKAYKGINAFWLSIVATRMGYRDPRWCTFNQIANDKYHPGQTWHLKKGSKGTSVEYWFPFDKVKHKYLTWEEYRKELEKLIRADEANPERFMICAKYYIVFNADCIEGIPELTKDLEKREMNELVLKTAKNMGVEIITDDMDGCYYMPRKDIIHLPKPEYFKTDTDLTATAFHELSHATGAAGRLSRPGIVNPNIFGSSDYAYEELIAEISSCFMTADIGTEMTKEHMDSHKGYVNSWIESIKKDPNVLIKAIKEATAAANYLNWKAELITEKEYQETLKETKVESKKNTGDETLERLCKQAAEFIDYNRDETYTLDDFHRDFPDLHNVDLVKTTDPVSGKELIVSFDLINHSYSRYLDRDLVDTTTFKTDEDFSLVLQSAIPEDFMDLEGIKTRDIEAQKAKLLAL